MGRYQLIPSTNNLPQSERLRVIFPDHLGLARGKVCSSEALDAPVFCSSGAFNQLFDRSLLPPENRILETEGLSDVELRFSQSDIRAGWSSGMKVAIADVYSHETAFPLCQRSALRRAVADWQELGISPRIGLEIEGYAFRSDATIEPAPYAKDAYMYATGHVADPDGLFNRITNAASANDISIESFSTEFGSGHFEFSMTHDEPVAAADNIFLFRELCRDIARESQNHITFLGRPLANAEGSALHINLSLHDDIGNNMLSMSPLPQLARQFIAGCLAHHRGLAAICNPTVNSYKRFGPGNIAGYWASWGFDHRLGVIRVPIVHGNVSRLEYRMADAATNPYLACAAVLQAGRLGVVHNLTCPDPATSAAAESDDYEHAPRDLFDAIQLLRDDEQLCASIGSTVVSHFLAIKGREWLNYVESVTDWEVRTYFPIL